MSNGHCQKPNCRIRLKIVLLIFSILLTFSARAAINFAVGNTSTVAGGTAVVSLVISNAPTNLSAFCLFLTNVSSLGLPVASAGYAQTNLIVYVDNFGNGIYRVTGFVTNDPPIGNGLVLNLTYATPPAIAPGNYGLALATNPPGNAPPGPNPEARSLVNSALLASGGSGGLIVIGTVSAPYLTSLAVLVNNSFQFAFTNVGGASFTVYAATNVMTPLSNWTAVGSASQSAPGIYQFTDISATNFPRRYYTVHSP